MFVRAGDVATVPLIVLVLVSSVVVVVNGYQTNYVFLSGGYCTQESRTLSRCNVTSSSDRSDVCLRCPMLSGSLALMTSSNDCSTSTFQKSYCGATTVCGITNHCFDSDNCRDDFDAYVACAVRNLTPEECRFDACPSDVTEQDVSDLNETARDFVSDYFDFENDSSSSAFGIRVPVASAAAACILALIAAAGALH